MSMGSNSYYVPGCGMEAIPLPITTNASSILAPDLAAGTNYVPQKTAVDQRTRAAVAALQPGGKL